MKNYRNKKTGEALKMGQTLTLNASENNDYGNFIYKGVFNINKSSIPMLLKLGIIEEVPEPDVTVDQLKVTVKNLEKQIEYMRNTIKDLLPVLENLVHDNK